MLQDLLLIGSPLLAITSLVLGIRSLFLPRLKIFGFRSEMGIFSGMIGFAAGTFLLIAAWPLPGHYPSKADKEAFRAKECIDTAYEKYSCKFMSSLNIEFNEISNNLSSADFNCIGSMKNNDSLEKIGEALYIDGDLIVHNYCGYHFSCKNNGELFSYTIKQRESHNTQTKDGTRYDLRCFENGDVRINID